MRRQANQAISRWRLQVNQTSHVPHRTSELAKIAGFMMKRCILRDGLNVSSDGNNDLALLAMSSFQIEEISIQ